MSTPISPIARIASGLTWVASVPALLASKRCPARCLSSPSAICERAELWVHRKRTLPVRDASAAATGSFSLLGAGEQPVGGLAEEISGGFSIEGVEAPAAPLLFANQPGVL